MVLAESFRPLWLEYDWSSVDVREKDNKHSWLGLGMDFNLEFFYLNSVSFLSPALASL